jgi:hypothetical protein
MGMNSQSVVDLPGQPLGQQRDDVLGGLRELFGEPLLALLERGVSLVALDQRDVAARVMPNARR